MTVDSSVWSTLVDLNKTADSLIERARKRIEPSPPVSRELLTNASVEVRFDNLTSYSPSVFPPNSDALAGNNVKRGIWTNGGSRLYLREIAFQEYVTGLGFLFELQQNNNDRFVYPPGLYFCWNFQTSITQKQYGYRRMSKFSAGRKEAGNHLSFRDPLVIEPMETFTLEVELLSSGTPGGSVLPLSAPFSYVLSFLLSGYREGM